MHVIPIFGGWRQENLKMEVILGYRARHHGLHDTLSQNEILLTAEETEETEEAVVAFYPV